MGDHIVIDGGMCELVVVNKAGPDVLAESIEQGLLLSKANMTFRCDMKERERERETHGQQLWQWCCFLAIACMHFSLYVCVAHSHTQHTCCVCRTSAVSVCRRNGELVRGRAALLPVISAKDWQVSGVKV